MTHESNFPRGERDALVNARWQFERAEMDLAEVVADYLEGHPRSSATQIASQLGLSEMQVRVALDFLWRQDELVNLPGGIRPGEDFDEMYYAIGYGLDA